MAIHPKTKQKINYEKKQIDKEEKQKELQSVQRHKKDKLDQYLQPCFMVLTYIVMVPEEETEEEVKEHAQSFSVTHTVV